MCVALEHCALLCWPVLVRRLLADQVREHPACRRAVAQHVDGGVDEKAPILCGASELAPIDADVEACATHSALIKECTQHCLPQNSGLERMALLLNG